MNGRSSLVCTPDKNLGRRARPLGHRVSAACSVRESPLCRRQLRSRRSRAAPRLRQRRRSFATQDFERRRLRIAERVPRAGAEIELSRLQLTRASRTLCVYARALVAPEPAEMLVVRDLGRRRSTIDVAGLAAWSWYQLQNLTQLQLIVQVRLEPQHHFVLLRPTPAAPRRAPGTGAASPLAAPSRTTR